MAIHSGKYTPKYIEPEMDFNSDPLVFAITGNQGESIKAARKLAVSGQKYIKRQPQAPDHDLKVIVRVLPTLQHYASCIRNRLKSREWSGQHDGMSLYVVQVEKIKVSRGFV